MTALTQSTLDGAALRQQFPILNQPQLEGRPPLAFLDSAASSQKPEQVIQAIDTYYRTINANIHRGVYELSEAATAAYEAARQTMATFLNARQARECIFVRNTTEAINLVARSWGRANLTANDRIVLTVMEHHSNLVPWHMLREEIGFTIDYIPLTDDHQLDMTVYAQLLEQKPKLVGFAHVSNAIGALNDVAAMTRMAHDAGAVVLVDAAQSVPHMPVDVQALDVDFLALSGHKMVGPMGSGVLYGKRELLEAMPPYMGGGSMIRKVTLDGTTFADIPARFEAGTPAVADQVGLAAAADYLTAVGLDAIREHELELLDYAMEQLPSVPHLTMYGPEDLSKRSGVISFTLGSIHPHDVAAILDGENIAVRAGHHCAQPLMAALGVVATTRASFYMYNTRDDVDRLVAGLHKANEVFGQV
ncbi:MAG: SufS family cysteine desulfurase [Thermomicrobiales bacterium]|nr:SufS family cysteine desulfurase [Thermomicrobiales bacterium]